MTSPWPSDALLGGHLVDSHRLRSDDFDGFFDDRLEALVLLISEAMGKDVARDDRVGGAEYEIEDEEPPPPEEVALAESAA